MQTAQTYSHRRAEEELTDKGLLDEVLGLANAPMIGIAERMVPRIKAHFESAWIQLGWANEPLVDPEHNLRINAMKQRVGMTAQTGNVARAFYDLLKFQAMYLRGRIDAAVLIVPTAAAASALGRNNIPNFTRVTDELSLFFHIITVPVFVVSFE
jgi:hypothetical protein